VPLIRGSSAMADAHFTGKTLDELIDEISRFASAKLDKHLAVTVVPESARGIDANCRDRCSSITGFYS